MPIPVESLTHSSDEYIHIPLSSLKKATIRSSSDFRSDVVTVPTPEVLEAMVNATFHDEIYEGDATIAALESKMAKMAGKEAAMWVVSGTQANQISLRTHLHQPPHSILCDHRAHIYCWESGAISVLSQAQCTPVIPRNRRHLTVHDIAHSMIPDGNIHFAPTKVISLENTLSGTILPLAEAQRIRQYALNHPNKPKMHLDGARLFDAVVAEGVSLTDYCDNFDSVSLCIQKGTGAPVGSMIVGDKPFIDRAKWYRKMFGGGARQPGMLAAAGIAALDQALPLIALTQHKAKLVSEYLTMELGLKLSVPTETNMIVLDLEEAGIPPRVFRHRLFQFGVRVFDQGRLVFHNQISDQGVSALCQGVKSLVIDARIPNKLDQLDQEIEYTESLSQN
ncbi:hypothetical protein E3P89_02402 [Wallemia ichthyophaga]|uniref:Aromatic amino acid beta-eliminating lyase/threonine aldolase domain-containing protein n=2 Tax=Wallemia ichthyophaga TaxID=245174 RepID=A0A4T0KNG6_WALIC|nr:putative low-specificity L-threonine aldolase [Wallemia ichthyophaga EXF-994]TIA70913.1 hypothetical protein E3P91_02858 [Wallemia ichthyophaga]EOR01086.1 putative low-specificity L-threonine aldolase [Wallemia ichthyophaga EXF-994]TIA90121.1 hypothetical protein E3P97_02721 [Wallemia ichthyophaga]TIA97379.1 hypothetical protein E3P95_02844 [Wallemia ichthyophaga]TIA99893.1 hypothetical protein E3P94_02424 [Wallemia ichthyophaga]